MGVKSFAKKVIGKVKDKIQEVKDDQEQSDKLQKWKGKLEKAMDKHNSFRSMAAEWDSIYNGTKQTGDSKNRFGENTEDARQVINLTMQLIEAQINADVPTPRVDALEINDEQKKDMIEGMLTYMSSGSELRRLTSLNERIVKKNSYCAFKVMYNPDYAAHTFRGKIETTNPHPCNVIPQPGVYKVADMDYMFHIENRTIDYVCSRYGEEFRSDLEEDNAEFSYLEDMSGSTATDTSNNLVSVIEAWYKDSDGDVCLLTWVNQTILKDEPKFYYKRDENNQPIMTEQITIQPQEQQQQDPNQPQQMPQTVEVQCRVPKRFPFVIWYNIPKEKSFYGKSDVEIIRDQQEGIKKLLSMEEEKQIKGTTKIFVRKGSGLKDKLTNATSQILETDDPNTDVITKDLKTPDNSLENLFNIYKMNAKEVLGVTDAYQGSLDNKTLSGKAIQSLSANSQARISVKQNEKEIAFTELYQLYYDFLIAFYDDKIPYRMEGADNNPKFGYFDKSQLIKQDAAGEWYYPEFDIYITTDSGITRDKNQLFQSTVDLATKGMMDSVELWTVLEYLGYPNASAILDMEKQKQQAQQQAAQGQQKGPSTSIAFDQLPPTGKAQLAAQAGIQVDPNEFASMDMQQQMQEQASKQQDFANQQAMKQTDSEQMQNQSNPQPQQQDPQQMIQHILSQLNPAEQQAFQNASPEQQQQILNQLLGGNQ
jgi:hypothetical protein